MRNVQNEESFIAQEVHKWSQHVAELVLSAIRRKKIQITKDLEQSVRGQSRQMVGELIFKEYGRMVDMGAGRGYKKGIESIASNRFRLTQGKERKPNKFYSKVAYGSLGGLINALLNTYSDKIIYSAQTNLKQP